MSDALVGMGFSVEHAELALKRTGYSLQRAADWLLEGGAESSVRASEPSAPNREREAAGTSSGGADEAPAFNVVAEQASIRRQAGSC